jgi:hypothetical protein
MISFNIQYLALLGGTSQFQGKAKIKFKDETGKDLAPQLSYLLMELRPRGAANGAAPQELPSILWNLKVQYRVH